MDMGTRRQGAVEVAVLLKQIRPAGHLRSQSHVHVAETWFWGTLEPLFPLDGICLVKVFIRFGQVHDALDHPDNVHCRGGE